MLGAVRRAVGEEHGGGGGDGVDDADHRLLRDVALAAARQGEDERAEDREDEREGVRLPGLELEAEQEGGRGAQRGDLREGDVDEDDLPRDDVEAEIGVDAR